MKIAPVKLAAPSVKTPPPVKTTTPMGAANVGGLSKMFKGR